MLTKDTRIMLQNILNFKGVTKLNREQQNQIHGQEGCCLGWECIIDSDCNDPEKSCAFGECLYFI